jgi:riboflavin kinase/FMN adenylyltransferase
MKIIRGLPAAKRINLKSTVCTIGVFDGVHIGHRKIIKAVVRQAHKERKTSLILTFWPHPFSLTDKAGLSLITSLEERLKLIKELGPDICLVMRFTKSISRLPPEKFLHEILLEALKMHRLIVGENFFFGKGASGDVKFLRRMSRIYNFKLTVMSLKKINGQPISSSYIRYLVNKGQIKLASKFLGRPL